MSAPDWLLEAMADAAAKLGWRYGGLDGGGMAVLTDDRGQESRFGLQNLERRLGPLPPGDRVERLIQHFRTLRTVRPASSLAAARERLLVRLRAAFEPGDDIGAHVWSGPVADTGLVQVLVIDMPDAMSYVTRDMIDESDRSGEEWLAFALDNLRAVSDASSLRDLGEGSGVFVGAAGDAYDAARALILDDLFDPPSTNGYLVAVPSRDRLLVYPVDPELLDARFPGLLIATLEMYAGQPYPISDGLFWVRAGEWEAIGYDYSDGELTVELPAGLRDLMGGEG
ncbi:MAG: hypothetical protein ACRC33_00825 [Gemmataceae bacterium]